MRIGSFLDTFAISNVCPIDLLTKYLVEYSATVGRQGCDTLVVTVGFVDWPKNGITRADRGESEISPRGR
jgi:predicted GH43/DUF377 family glycosyl hydrolase